MTDRGEAASSWREVVAACDYLADTHRRGLSGWDALEEAIRCWTAEWTSPGSDLIAVVPWNDPDPLRTSLDGLLGSVAEQHERHAHASCGLDGERGPLLCDASTRPDDIRADRPTRSLARRGSERVARWHLEGRRFDAGPSQDGPLEIARQALEEIFAQRLRGEDPGRRAREHGPHDPPPERPGHRAEGANVGAVGEQGHGTSSAGQSGHAVGTIQCASTSVQGPRSASSLRRRLAIGAACKMRIGSARSRDHAPGQPKSSPAPRPTWRSPSSATVAVRPGANTTTTSPRRTAATARARTKCPEGSPGSRG